MSLRARTSIGQHWLKDKAVLARLIEAIDPKPSDCFFEIGPGQGVLTEPLLASGARVLAVEKDPRCAKALDALAKRYPGRLVWHDGDVLTFPFWTHRFEGQDDPFRVVGNLPYCISSPIMFYLIEALDSVLDAHFMLQKEVVDRLAAVPGGKAWGRLSIMVQRHLSAASLEIIPPEAFNPPPKVVSATVRLLPLASPPRISDAMLFDQIVRLAFQQRRKQLKNSLSSVFEASDWDALSLTGQERPESCSILDFIALADVASKR